MIANGMDERQALSLEELLNREDLRRTAWQPSWPGGSCVPCRPAMSTSTYVQRKIVATITLRNKVRSATTLSNSSSSGVSSMEFSPADSDSDASVVEIRNSKNSTSREKYPKKKARVAANMRERRRMRHLNEAFADLKACIPFFVSDRKVDILKAAILHIKRLMAMRDEADAQRKMPMTSPRLVNSQGRVVLFGQPSIVDVRAGRGSTDMQPCSMYSLSYEMDKSRPASVVTCRLWSPRCDNETPMFDAVTVSSVAPVTSSVWNDCRSASLMSPASPSCFATCTDFPGFDDTIISLIRPL